MPLWNLVLTGYPSSGRTLHARRLVQDRPNFVRISGDDLRKMFFSEPAPSRDEELLFSMLVIVPDELLRRQYNVLVDATAPTNRTRSYLMRKVPNVDSLLIVIVAVGIRFWGEHVPEDISERLKHGTDLGNPQQPRSRRTSSGMTIWKSSTQTTTC